MQKSPKSTPTIPIPVLEQWAILSQQRALEAQHLLHQKRQTQQTKKIKFKNDLDAQVQERKGGKNWEYESDRDYMRGVLERAEEERRVEERGRAERVERRKRIQEENLRKANMSKNSKVKLQEPEYTLEIGVQSQLLQKQKQKKGIKQMMDTLDLQIRQKHREGIRSRQSQSHSHNNEQVSTSFVKDPVPNPARSPKYRQDQRIYEVYENALKQKKKQQQQFYNKITSQASQKIARQNQLRTLHEKQKKQHLTSQLLTTLQSQVKAHSLKLSQQRAPNPQQAAFTFISPLFRPHPSPYDKNLYSEQLRRQAEEDRQRRLQEKYMSQQQYKFNMNQLNRIVEGKYLHEKYLDRSMDSIGATEMREMPVRSFGENSEYIKGEIEKLRNRQRSGFYSRMEY